MSQFRERGGDSSPTFKLWLMFLDMVQIIMRNIWAEREGYWNLHLSWHHICLTAKIIQDGYRFILWTWIDLPMSVKKAFDYGQFSVWHFQRGLEWHECWNDGYSRYNEQWLYCWPHHKGIGFTSLESLDEWSMVIRSRSGIHPVEISGHEQTRPTTMNGDDQNARQMIHDKMTISMESLLTFPVVWLRQKKFRNLFDRDYISESLSTGSRGAYESVAWKLSHTERHCPVWEIDRQ